MNSLDISTAFHSSNSNIVVSTMVFIERVNCITLLSCYSLEKYISLFIIKKTNYSTGNRKQYIKES